MKIITYRKCNASLWEDPETSLLYRGRKLKPQYCSLISSLLLMFKEFWARSNSINKMYRCYFFLQAIDVRQNKFYTIVYSFILIYLEVIC